MSLQHSVQFGEFILCPVNQQLQTPEQSITLEPKVYSVLCYLLANHERFVSLEELHQQVWAGRVVSDTAVRRTISKLRAALQDQTDTPQYIQSAAKRGYRWLQPPQPFHDETAFTARTADVVVPSRHVAVESAKPERSTQPHLSTGAMDKASLAARWPLLLALVILLFAVIAGFMYQHHTSSLWQRGDPLRTIEGEKLSLAISPDKAAIVFSSNSTNHPGQELYWHHRATGVTRHLTSGNHQIMWVEFHHDGQSLFYHDFQQGLYQLYQRPISANGQWQGPAKALLAPQPVMFQLKQIPNEEKLFISMGNKDSMQIQQLDLTTGELEPVTHAVIGNTQDYLFALSGDSSMLAYLRMTTGQPQLLTIMHRETGRVLKQTIYPDRVFSIVFVDEERLLILDEHVLHLMHWPSGELQALDSNRGEHESSVRGLSRFVVRSGDNEWLQNRIVGDVGGFVNHQGPIGQFTSRTLLNTDTQTNAMYFTTEPDQFLVVERNDQISRLLLQSSGGRRNTVLEVQDEQLSVQGIHPDGELVLLLVNRKPHLFNLPQGKLSPLPVSSHLWQQAMFEASGEAVILNYIEHGTPVSWRYQLDTMQSSILHQGERVVAVLASNEFIVLRQDDQNFARVRDGQQEILPVQTLQQFVGSIHVRDTKLYWGETDLKHTWIYRYDLARGELEQWQADRRQMLQSFDISPDGQRWLLRHTARVDTQIYPVTSKL
ncbi:winged helix-turn-helix domain-containing protein [Alkalimonas amylolytica]|uniref:Transcriptional regulatory protein, C terminal n=1 Tax=Alkalimonas amylolytica TaxID=152573 RepID=A0A1H4DBV5_ALKAM|nr:winged helix-turn-helix domain-containing protein [Alkalimonas amylolytica]SEA69996.1 Transcriptional regulatory protein, C terminal [Alkalimonas amylolytica]